MGRVARGNAVRGSLAGGDRRGARVARPASAIACSIAHGWSPTTSCSTWARAPGCSSSGRSTGSGRTARLWPSTSRWTAWTSCALRVTTRGSPTSSGVRRYCRCRTIGGRRAHALGADLRPREGGVGARVLPRATTRRARVALRARQSPQHAALGARRLRRSLRARRRRLLPALAAGSPDAGLRRREHGEVVRGGGLRERRCGRRRQRR